MGFCQYAILYSAKPSKKFSIANDNLSKHIYKYPQGEIALYIDFIFVIVCQTACWAVCDAVSSVLLHMGGTLVLRHTVEWLVVLRQVRLHFSILPCNLHRIELHWIG